jgi:hypothetical protein
MKRLASSLLALTAFLAVADAAAAQGRPSITLFEGPNFSGRSRSFTDNVGNLGGGDWNDRAMSAQVRGAWRVCFDANLKGRCATLDRDVANLDQVGMGRAISSMELEGFGGGGGGGGRPPGGGYPGGPGPGFPGGGGGAAGPSLEGRSAVFFPNPRTPGGGRRAADEFCRRMGLGQSLYSDDRSPDLRDVLCAR